MVQLKTMSFVRRTLATLLAAVFLTAVVAPIAAQAVAADPAACHCAAMMDGQKTCPMAATPFNGVAFSQCDHSGFTGTLLALSPVLLTPSATALEPTPGVAFHAVPDSATLDGHLSADLPPPRA